MRARARDIFRYSVLRLVGLIFIFYFWFVCCIVFVGLVLMYDLLKWVRKKWYLILTVILWRLFWAAMQIETCWSESLGSRSALAMRASESSGQARGGERGRERNTLRWLEPRTYETRTLRRAIGRPGERERIREREREKDSGCVYIYAHLVSVC